MSRFGIPMYEPLREVRCFVTVRERDGSERVRLWKGRSFQSIKRAATKHHEGCKLLFGRPYSFTL